MVKERDGLKNPLLKKNFNNEVWAASFYLQLFAWALSDEIC